MKFFIDTTDIDAIKAAHSWGIIDGVMIDRSQLGDGDCDLERRLSDICRIVDGPVIVDVSATEAQEIVKEVNGLASRHSNAVFRIPVTPEGMMAVRRLSDEGVRIGVGPVRTPAQALIAAKSGAEYISVPISGPDMGHGIDVVRDAVGMIETYGFECEVVGVGVHSSDDVLAAIRADAHAIVLSVETVCQLFAQS